MLFPIVLAAMSLYNLYDEFMVRWLHRYGTSGEGRILSVKRSMPKDRLRYFTPNAKDVSNTYDTKCDYILSLAYTPESGSEVAVKDMIVPAMIKISGGMAFPAFRAEDTVPVLYCKRLKRRVVIDREDVKKFQTKKFEMVLWIACAIAAVIILIAMLATK